MENQFAVPENGAEVRKQDIDLVSENAGLADDRVLFELLRPTVGSATPQKGILPYGKSGWAAESGLNSTALVQGNVANGSIRVMPFRAIVGSTNTSDQTEKLRGQRSGYLVGAATQYTTVALAANASGNPRIDLIYAIVAPDADGDSATYVRKNPTTGVVSTNTDIITTKTTVTVTKVTGTPGATPTPPTLPADGAGAYNIQLCYVWVPSGFGAASTVGRGAIAEIAPCLPIHSSTGVATCMPANQQWFMDTDGTSGTVDGNQADTSDRSLQNGAYLPSTMQGKEERLIMLQLGLSPASHVDGDVVDDSIDWRYRFFRWTIHYQAGSTAATAFASDRNNSPANPTMGIGTTTTVSGCGQSFVDDHVLLAYSVSPSGAGTALLHDLGAGGSNYVILYVRGSDGALVFKLVGTLAYQAFIWLEATAPYSNYGTV